MSNFSVNFSTSETPQVISTAQRFEVVNILEMSVYSISLLFGLPAHCCVILLILTGAGTGISPEFFILNLSVCEVGICFNGLIFILSMWFQSLSIFDQLFIGLSITGRPLFQCLICVERYLAVVHPVTFLKFKPLRYRVICSTAAWMIILGSCLFCMFTMGPHYFIYVWIMSVQLLIFLFIKLFCLLAVLRALKQSGPGERGREREEENSMKRRAFYLILITTVSTVITFGPFILTGLYTIITHTLVDIPVVWLSAFVCFLLAGFVQPLLYLHRTGKLSCLCLPKN